MNNQEKFKKVPVFILAGGLGTRLSEETQLRPKPMVEIGDAPVLVHLMRWYYSQGFTDFVICGGYKSWFIKDYFLNYEALSNDIEIDHRETSAKNPAPIKKASAQEKWRVRVLDTGAESMTGSRIAQAFDRVSKEEGFEDFAVTYGDGLCNVNLAAEFEFHQKHKKIGTVLGVKPVARFGELEHTDNDLVSGFVEKPESKQGLINGGFFFFKKNFREYLSSDVGCILERSPLEKLAKDSQLMMFRHNDFWQPMDTLRDKTYLQELWQAGKAPWKV